jgi:hypothetical protein
MALRLHNKWVYPYCFLAVSAAVVIGWFRFAPHQQSKFLLSMIGAVAGFFYFIYRKHLDETKLFKELFIGFNQRYDSMNDTLNSILNGPPERPLSEDERRGVYRYFNLCAEEHFFYEAGYIDQKVWEAWAKGMSILYKNPRVQEVWKNDWALDSYYGFKPPL